MAWSWGHHGRRLPEHLSVLVSAELILAGQRHGRDALSRRRFQTGFPTALQERSNLEYYGTPPSVEMTRSLLACPLSPAGCTRTLHAAGPLLSPGALRHRVTLPMGRCWWVCTRRTVLVVPLVPPAARTERPQTNRTEQTCAGAAGSSDPVRKRLLHPWEVPESGFSLSPLLCCNYNLFPARRSCLRGLSRPVCPAAWLYGRHREGVAQGCV